MHDNGLKRVSILLLCLLALAFATNVYADGVSVGADKPTETHLRGRVLAVEDRPGADEFFRAQWVTLEIYGGEGKGEVITVENHLSDHPLFDIVVEPGDRVLLVKETLPTGETEIYMVDYVRDTYILWVLIVFLSLILLIGKWKGVKTIVTLVFTLFMIVQVLLPGMLKGYSPILLTVGVSFIITLVTIVLINGVNVKSVSAIAGTFGGLLAAGLVMYLAGSQVRLTGLSSEEAVMLLHIPQAVNFDFRYLLFAGIIMGALGAVMDVGMSIASAMTEMHRLNPEVKYKHLFASGMNVGKDIMTTMTNTLILAYTGAALPLLLLFVAYETSMVKILNLDLIATEIVRALSGSIGLLLAIPLTVGVSSWLLKRSA